MTVEAFLSLITQLIFLWVAGSTLFSWLQQRNGTRLDIALVFVAQAVAIIAQILQPQIPAMNLLVFVGFVAQPYLLLRVARYFERVTPRVMGAATISLVLVVASLVLIGVLPILVFVIFIVYFLVLEGYATALFLRGARKIGGLTAKRLRLVAVGSALLSLVFVIALGVAVLVVALLVVTPEMSPVAYNILQAVAAFIKTYLSTFLNSFLQILAIGSGLSYYFGFVPPRVLREAWQFEEVQPFLQTMSAKLSNDSEASLKYLADTAQHTVGGVTAIARWDSAAQHLSLAGLGNLPGHYGQLEAEGGVLAEVWQSKKPRQAHPPTDVGPQLAEWAKAQNARTLFAVPIVSDQTPWGVLLVAVGYEPLFASDDLELLSLLVSQTAAAIAHTALIEDLKNLNQSLEQRVTERAAALQESERQYRNLVENALVGVFRSKTNGEILYLNRKSLEMFGYEDLETFVYEKALTHYRNPQDRFRMLERLQADGHVNEMEIEFMTRQGEPKTFLFSASITGDVLEGMTTDITARKLAEQFILKQADRAQAVSEVSRALTSAQLDYQGVLEAAARRTAELVGDACVIRLLSDDGQWLTPVAAYHTDPEQLELLQQMFASAPLEASFGLPSRVVQSGQPLLLPVVTEDQLKLVTKQEYWPFLAQMALNSVLIAPLYEGERIIGALSLSRHKTVHPYTPDDETLLMELADRIMLALMNARLYQEAQNELVERKRAEAEVRLREAHAQSLLRLAQKLERAQNHTEILEAAQAEMKIVLGFDSVWIYLFSTDRRFATALIAGGGIAGEVAKAENATLVVEGDQMMEELAEALDMVVVEDARTDPRTKKEIVERLGNRTIVNVPMYLLGQRLGALGTGSFGLEPVRPITGLERDFLQAMAKQIGVSIDRVQALTERRAAEEALRQSEERFAKAFRASPAAVTITRLTDGTFVEVNEVFLRLMGYTTEEIIGRRSTELEMFDDPSERADLIKRLQADGSVRNHEMTMRTHTGGRLNVLFSTEIIELNSEKHALALLFDITQRKEAEAKLQQTLQKLEVNNRELQDFAYVASHDLQEPLRKIQAFGDRLKKQAGAQLDDKSRDYLERMQSAAARMQALINDLLTFSRVTTKAQPFVRTDLDNLVSEVLSDLEIRLERSGGRVEVGQLGALEVDASQMRQVIQNLVGNALKFHKPEVPPVVTVSGQEKAGYYELRVADNGIGFDEKYLDRIFTPFQRLHGRGEYEGTGIGLSVVRKIVDRHGGQVTAQSRPDEGATFIITLPTKHKLEIEQ